MKSSNKPQRLGDVLDEVIDELGLRGKLHEAEAIETWAVIAGPQINAVTESVWMKNGKLFIKISSATWRHELHLNRRNWLERLNSELEEFSVDELVFR